jgi:hypothetical protein
MADFRQSNHWVVTNGYFVCVYQRHFVAGVWWGALFKIDGADDKPTFVYGTFSDAEKVKRAALEEVGECLARQRRSERER